MPKMPMAMSQFRQCVVLAKQLMKKHTKEEDEQRAKRRELRLIRKERYEQRALDRIDGKQSSISNSSQALTNFQK